MSKEEALQELLPLVKMSRPELESQVFGTPLIEKLKTDSTMLWCFTALGLGGRRTPTDKDSEIFLFGSPETGSENFLFRGVAQDAIVDRKADADKFLNEQFNFELVINNQHFVCDKIASEPFALVLDWKENPIGAIRFIQDTRSPWVLIPGDTRPFGLAATNKDRPDKHGCCKVYRWWTENAIKDKSGKMIRNKFGIKVMSLNAFVDQINDTVFGVETLSYVEPKNLSRTEKRNFIGSAIFSGSTPDGRTMEIVKNAMAANGEIYVTGVLIGEVTVLDNNKSYDEFPVKITTDKSALSELGVTHQLVMQTINKMLTVEKPDTTRRGKGEFRNTSISDAFAAKH